MSETTFSPCFYRFSRVLISFLARLFFRLQVFGVDHVPKTGGCIIAANHVSFLDPPLLACGIPHRYVRYLARDTLMKPWAKKILLSIAVIPMSRDRGDLGALKKALQFLKEGSCIGLFPEGTRSADGEVKEAKGGIGFLVAKSGVPLIPAYLDGTFEAYPRGAKRIKPCKIKVFYGEPIMPETWDTLLSSSKDYEKIGQIVMDRIRALKPIK